MTINFKKEYRSDKDLNAKTLGKACSRVKRLIFLKSKNFISFS